MRGALIALALMIFASPVLAEGMTDEAYTAVLLDLNRIKPTQNPQFAQGKDKISARILDKNKRTAGRVEDIALAPDGTFQTIFAHIDGPGFPATMGLDVASYIVEPTPKTFTLNMDKQQIRQNASQLTVNADAVSGTGNAPFTLNQIRAAEIKKADGSGIGQVQDVLIDDRAYKIAALIVTITNGSGRGATIAVPYEAAAAQHSGNRAVLTVTDAQADIMTRMAKR